MKNLFFLLAFFSFFCSFSQEAYFVDLKGNKTEIRPDDYDIISIDSRFSYKLPGKTWEKYIRYKELDYAVLGSYFFKVFPFKKNRFGLYVIAEYKNLKLAGIIHEYTTTSGMTGAVTGTLYYAFYIIENDNEIIYSDTVYDSTRNKFIEGREELINKLKSSFSECQPFIEKINSLTNSNDADRLEILSLLKNPIYVKYN
jgi:hypothetical protein